MLQGMKARVLGSNQNMLWLLLRFVVSMETLSEAGVDIFLQMSLKIRESDSDLRQTSGLVQDKAPHSASSVGGRPSPSQRLVEACSARVESMRSCRQSDWFPL